MATKITTRVLADDAVTDAKIADVTLTTATQSASDNTTKIATTAYVTTAIANLADSAPSTLNTLNELAAALNDDASFSTTVTNSIATKLPLAGGSLTGDLTIAFDSNNAGNRLRIADTEGSSAAVRTYSTSDGTGLILNHYYAVAGSPYLRYSDFVSSMADGAATKMRFLTKPQNANPAVALTIDQSQNVGIGTTTPSKNLHISGTGSELLVEGTNNSVSSLIAGVSVKAHHYRKAGLTIYDESDNEDFFIGRPYGASNHFDIINDGTLRFRINVFGNVGIGTSSPSNKLHVTGSAISGASADANSMLYLENNANNSIQINSSSSLNGQIRFGDADSNYRGAITYNHSTDSLTFTTAGSDRMLINSSGDISMNRRLYLAGAGQEFIQSAGSLRIDIDHDNNQTDRIFVVSKHNAATELMRVQEDGNVAIGRTANIAHPLDIQKADNAYIRISSGTTQENAGIIFANQNTTKWTLEKEGSAHSLFLKDASSTAVTFAQGGNVGIGTNSPGHPLHIVESADGTKIRLTRGGVCEWDFSIGNSSTLSGVGSGALELLPQNGGTANEFAIGTAGSTAPLFHVTPSRNYFLRRVGILTTSPTGLLHIDGAGSENESGDAKVVVTKNSSNDWAFSSTSGADDYGYKAIGNGSYAYAVYNQPSSAYRGRWNYDGQIYLNGGSSAVYNINSDVRLKEDITDCPSQWNLIKGLPLQRFHWKDRREGDKWSYGFIAQEVEKTNPEFVETVQDAMADTGAVQGDYKTVAEGQIHERALAALQEAMARIETLEAEVAALKE